MKKLNLFIIGALKCGTTSLMTWLAELSNVYSRLWEEPQFQQRLPGVHQHSV